MAALKGLLVSLLVATGMGFGFVASTGAAGQPTGNGEKPPALKVNISNFFGTPKIKVARKLRVSVVCNRNCGMRVKGSLRMPVGNANWSAAQGMAGGQTWTITYRLNNLGLRYLRQYFNNSWYVIRASAKDPKTGKRTVKTRNFRFRLR